MKNFFLALTLFTFFTMQSAEEAKKDPTKFECFTMNIACNTHPQAPEASENIAIESLKELLQDGHSLKEIRKATIKHVENCPAMHLSTLRFFKTYGESQNLDF